MWRFLDVWIWFSLNLGVSLNIFLPPPLLQIPSTRLLRGFTLSHILLIHFYLVVPSHLLSVFNFGQFPLQCLQVHWSLLRCLTLLAPPSAVFIWTCLFSPSEVWLLPFFIYSVSLHGMTDLSSSFWNIRNTVVITLPVSLSAKSVICISHCGSCFPASVYSRLVFFFKSQIRRYRKIVCHLFSIANLRVSWWIFEQLKSFFPIPLISLCKDRLFWPPC